jgi:hypothetical protein
MVTIYILQDKFHETRLILEENLAIRRPLFRDDQDVTLATISALAYVRIKIASNAGDEGEAVRLLHEIMVNFQVHLRQPTSVALNCAFSVALDKFRPRRAP